MPENICLKWDDFQDNVNSAFGNLRGGGDFSDVTLACEDGQHIEAHRLILAASSPFFQDLLRRSKQAYPIIYMKGIRSEDLISIIDFLYCGEANIYQDNLDSFLAIAQDLKLKGLMAQNEDENETEEKSNPGSLMGQKEGEKETEEEKSSTGSSRRSMQMNSKLTLKREGENTTLERSKEILIFDSGDLQALDEKVKLMMVKSQNLIPSGKKRADICKVCGKEGEGIAIRDHIESKHLEGVSLPCNTCGNTFKTRRQLRMHKYNCFEQ